MFQVHKEKGRDSKKSGRNHSSRVRHAIDRETEEDSVKPFRENEIIEHHCTPPTAFDDDGDILALIQKRDIIRSQKAQELESNKHVHHVEEHTPHHRHHNHHNHQHENDDIHSRSSTRSLKGESIRSEKIHPELDVVVESFDGSSTPCVKELPISDKKSAKISNREHDFSRKQAYALEENQPLERAHDDPFYIRVEPERFVKPQMDFSMADEHEDEYGNKVGRAGGARNATIDVHAIERQTARQIRNNKVCLGAFMCFIITGICVWVAVSDSGLQ